MNRLIALQTFVLVLAMLVNPGHAEPADPTPTVGFMITHPPVDDIVVDLFRAGLGKYGYTDGENVTVEVRTALGELDRVPALVEELVQIPVDVIVVVNEVALRVAMGVTSTIPVVMIGSIDDPVDLGMIDSYSRPGGNVTGVFNANANLSGKRLEVLKDTLPDASRVAVLWDVFSARQRDEMNVAASDLKLDLDLIEIRNSSDLEPAFLSAKSDGAAAVLMNFSPVFWVNRHRIAAMAIETGLPVMSDLQILTRSGFLLSYGADTEYNWQRGGYFVDRLLKGADPAELPVERLSRLSLAVNVRTARALGVAIPNSIMLRANEIIQ